MVGVSKPMNKYLESNNFKNKMLLFDFLSNGSTFMGQPVDRCRNVNPISTVGVHVKPIQSLRTPKQEKPQP